MMETDIMKRDEGGGGGSGLGGGLQVLMFSMLMLVGSYVSGSIPLFVPLSGEKLKLVSTLGAGLLLGTALAVIIPEGIVTLVSTNKVEGLDSSVGTALVLGFLFMLLVDQIASSAGKMDPESQTTTTTTKRISWTTTLGLVVHAAADGIALGAAVTTNHADIEMIVFLAIMLHKAPAAFGLVTYLLHEGLDRKKIRKHLLVFALSAPLTAVSTYILLYGGHSINTLSATGIAMLFSAGTFLYVATVHVLPEVTSSGHSHSSGGDGNHGFSKCQLLFLVLGTLIPLLLTLGHHHKH